MSRLLISVCAVAAIHSLGMANGLDVITSPVLTNWGTWAKDFERCPEGRAAQGFQLLTERAAFLDFTGMNGLRLYCGNPADGVTPSVTSNVGPWGEWRKKFRCAEQGYMTGFQLKVENPRYVVDNSATTNIRFWCTKNGNQYIEGDGQHQGEWTAKTECPSGQVICGLKTQIQKKQGILVDDTAMNNVAFECCPPPVANL